MRVLVCGSRYLTEEHGVAILERLERLPGEDHHLIWGGADGADTLARHAAGVLGWTSTEFPADWKRHGRTAGPLRNQRMLDEGRPDVVLAFHTEAGLGRGTADMVRRARAAGVPVEVVIL